MEIVETEVFSFIFPRLVLQASIPAEKASCHCDPEVLAELQGQEVLPRHQERILQAAGSHPVSSSDQQAAAGARDDRQTAGSLQRILREALPAEGEVGRGLPAETGPGLDSQEEREEAEGRFRVSRTGRHHQL